MVPTSLSLIDSHTSGIPQASKTTVDPKYPTRLTLNTPVGNHLDFACLSKIVILSSFPFPGISRVDLKGGGGFLNVANVSGLWWVGASNGVTP